MLLFAFIPQFTIAMYQCQFKQERFSKNCSRSILVSCWHINPQNRPIGMLIKCSRSFNLSYGIYGMQNDKEITLSKHYCDDDSLFLWFIICHFEPEIYDRENWENELGATTYPSRHLYLIRRRRLTGIGIHIINMRRLSGRLRFTIGISIPVRWHFF